jgi:hypothetical protein
MGPPPEGQAVAPGTAAGLGGGQVVPNEAPLGFAAGAAGEAVPGVAHSDVAGGAGPSAGGTGAGSAVAWPPAKAPEPGAAALRAE